MRELRALGLTDDGKSLVLVDLSRGAEGERFRVAADERLRAALRSGTPRAAVPQAETRVESALSPREIQARLRAGATADEVAKAAGIPVGRVQRYEAPILAERNRVVSEARRASAPGPHRNTPGRPLGGLVDDRLEQEGADPEQVEWDAKRRPDGTWLVTLAMETHGEARATWSWDPQARRVRAVDAGATAVLAPMPAPSTGPDSLTAVAEATGVAPSSLPREAEQAAIAVGDDLRRRSGSGRSEAGRSAGRANGLVVLAGRNEDGLGSTTVTAADAELETAVTAADASLDSDVPGGSSVTPPARTERARVKAEIDDILLPGTEPATAPRPSRQERFPSDVTAGPLATTTAQSASARPAGQVDRNEAASESPNDESATVRNPRAGSGRRRSAVPAWDDIMFGARRG